MTSLKEALLLLRGGKYVYSHTEDEEILRKYLDPEKFLQKLEIMYHDDSFMRFKKCLRILRALQLVAGVLMLIFLLAFVVVLIANFSAGNYSNYENLYLGFCGICLLFFVMILLLLFYEARYFPKLREKILKKLQETMQEEFVECSLMINIDRSLTIRVRPLMAGEDGADFDIDKMDYYDYINYNNPEDEDYYTKQNPYELDPHEKNIVAEMVRKREKDIEKERKTSKKLKFLGGSKDSEDK